jgi:succinate-semialdehyde dehydrogenase/glutarate-semialdehyde dehydrogenase
MTREAILAAQNALPAWKARTADERATLLEAWHGLILASKQDLARIMTAEQGKPLAEAEGEIGYAASFVKWFAAEGRRISGHDIPAPTRPPHSGAEGAGRCLRDHHAMEFSGGDDHAQDRPGSGGGLHGGHQALGADALHRAGAGPSGRAGGHSGGVVNIVTGLPEGIGGALTASPWCANSPSPDRRGSARC